MTIKVLQLLIDFGLVVLIWVVQLLIYPSFKFYTNQELFNWHKRYTKNMAIVVIPLMLMQLGISVYFIFQYGNWLNVFHLLFIIIAWLLTYFIFVPIHSKLSNNINYPHNLQSLVKRNWLRVLVWNLVFVISVLINKN